LGGGSTLTLPFAVVNFFAGTRRALFGLLSFFGDSMAVMRTSLLSCLICTGDAADSLFLFRFPPASLSYSDSVGTELNSESDSSSSTYFVPVSRPVALAPDRVCRNVRCVRLAARIRDVSRDMREVRIAIGSRRYEKTAKIWVVMNLIRRIGECWSSRDSNVVNAVR
jgi:hypothetical protein